MRALLFTTAGSGHFLPAVPYARALVAAGHDVAVSAPSSFRPSVEAAGFAMLARRDIPPEAFGPVVASMAHLSALEGSVLYFREVFGRLSLESGLDGARAAIHDWRPDVVLMEDLDITGLVAAQEAGTPQVLVAIALQAVASAAWRILAEALTSTGHAEAAARIGSADRLTAVPPTLEGESMAVSSTHRFRTEPGDAAGDDLPDWWPGNSDPLIYMTLGSAAGHTDLFPDFYRALANAVAGMPVRVLFTIGGDADPAALGILPANVHVEPWWPQDDVMRLASAMVFHGGYGTMLSALAAGVPSVSIPLVFAPDQHRNAARLAEIGTGITLQGPEAIAGLPGAVRQVMDDESFRVRATELATEISALPPPAEAVPIVESIAMRH